MRWRPQVVAEIDVDTGITRENRQCRRDEWPIGLSPVHLTAEQSCSELWFSVYLLGRETQQDADACFLKAPNFFSENLEKFLSFLVRAS